MLTLRSALVLALLTLSTPIGAAEPDLRVVDGDSLVIGGEAIRLHGIDAPEMNQTCDRNGAAWRCGKWSARVLADAIGTASVTCERVDTDRYGRTVATCRVGRMDLGAHMVRTGAARAYLRYSNRYAAHEAQAKADQAGIWASRMVTPEVYRHPADPAPASAKDCNIKGNVSAKGARIYHLPGQRDYDKTRISASKGEAYFCSEAQARAAGFRRSKR